jgi:hypothetical protein
MNRVRSNAVRDGAVPRTTAPETSVIRTREGVGNPSRSILPVWIIWALVIVQFALALVVPKLGTLVGCAVVVTIIWLARAEYLPALIMTQLSLGDFGIGARGWDVPSFAGFNFNLNYMLALGVVARVTWELINRPQTFRSLFWMLALWYVAMGPAVIMCVMGRMERNPTWTEPIRKVWMCGAFFYGFILARTWRPDGRIITRGLLPVGAIIMFFAALGPLRDVIRFALIPTIIPLAWYTWRKGGFMRRTFAVMAAVLGAMTGLGIGLKMGGEEVFMTGAAGKSLSSNMGVGGATISINALFFGSLFLTMAIALGRPFLRRTLSRALGIPAFILVVAFSIGIGAIGRGDWSRAELQSGEASVRERLEAKIFGDRGVIWNATLVDIMEPPYVIKPAGRSVWINHPWFGWIEWPHGAHNAILNTLGNQRWFNGTILLILAMMAIKRNAEGLGRPLPGGLDAVAVGIAVTAVVGMIVNDYPINVQGAFWFFGFAGIVACAEKEARRHSPQVRVYSGGSRRDPT